jgi:glycosyltransferase A (GT-A) superfamily protein (DUF2064 family)
MPRYVVLFAREPGREARAKGFSESSGGEFFAALARGWTSATLRAGARLAVATPREDRPGWSRWIPPSERPLWLDQRGASFGERLERAGRDASELGGHAVLVGGDVVPSAEVLDRAFRLLENGADAVVAPARDGGFSLVALRRDDIDLLARVAPRQPDACDRLCRSLLARGRTISRIDPAPDVDGRRDVRAILRDATLGGDVRAAALRVLGAPVDLLPSPPGWLPPAPAAYRPGLRAPPPPPSL